MEQSVGTLEREHNKIFPFFFVSLFCKIIFLTPAPTPIYFYIGVLFFYKDAIEKHKKTKNKNTTKRPFYFFWDTQTHTCMNSIVQNTHSSFQQQQHKHTKESSQQEENQTKQKTTPVTTNNNKQPTNQRTNQNQSTNKQIISLPLLHIYMLWLSRQSLYSSSFFIIHVTREHFPSFWGLIELDQTKIINNHPNNNKNQPTNNNKQTTKKS